ncbi:radical SAM protein [Caulobacter sp. SLTY]|uniref:radical SAM protein n=1 Tax=Caulobacter sp. SLTY TaxID=2683262 RepID=UPI00196AE491|nr:radical SAM protein [Caulobacter sp. SLTY]
MDKRHDGDLAVGEAARSPFLSPAAPRLDPRKFQDPRVTLDGSPRAAVALRALDTLWFNTGTLCNIACLTCYIESSPRNDALSYLALDEVRGYLDEIETLGLQTSEIGFTGGEPFMNAAIIPMLEASLTTGRRTLVLTNAMRPMRRFERQLIELRRRFGDALVLRVSLDHHSQAVHEAERGADTWAPALSGLQWLAREGFSIAIAGRRLADEDPSAAAAGYAALLSSLGIALNVDDPSRLVLFPEMDATRDAPEITEACWGILGLSPESVMCASSRMVVKRKGAATPAVVACTLTPYDPQFELGATLAQALGTVPLNHPHCARFCVLGGASCS